MFTINNYLSSEVGNLQKETFATFPIAIEVLPESELDLLVADLSPETPWAERQIAARNLGQSRNSAAMPILLLVLLDDPFWMVRCTIIQALERIGDSRAIPTLRELSISDEFSAVRSAAEKAVERLSQNS